jgi:uncharacterized protein involved in exopolysaccharide biosynthesis
MESQFDIRAYLAILRRRFMYLLLPAILVAIGGVGVAYIMPPVYNAGATILVESQQIPTDLASPTVTANAAERIQVIQQRLLTRDNLLQIASKFNLYKDLGPDTSPSEIVDSMRAAIAINQIDTARVARQNAGVIGFTVGFQYRDASTAARVTNELVSSILSQNVETRLSRATETSDFFAQQAKDLEQRLLDIENKIAEFRQANEAAIPETLAERRAQLTLVNQKILEVNQQIATAASASGQDPLAASAGTLKQLTYNLQMKQLQLQSDQDARDRQADLAEKGLVPANSVKDFDNKLAIDQLAVDAIQAQIADQGGAGSPEDALKLLKDQRDDLEKQAAALNDSILKTPLVQVELNGLNRDYDNLQNEYKQAQAKVEDAQTGERLEQDRQAERFEVIEQATVPDTPSSPDRPKIMIAGVFGGLAFGVGLVVLRQMLDSSVYTAADLEKHLQLRPIATIPYVVTSRERWRKRWLIVALILVAIGVLVAALVVIDLYYLPLDLLAERLWDKIYPWLAKYGLVR